MQPTVSRISQYVDDQQSKLDVERKHQETIQAIQAQQNALLDAFRVVIQYLRSTSKTEVVNPVTSVETPDVAALADLLQSVDATLKTHRNTDTGQLEQLLGQAITELQAIPKELPAIDIPEAVTVKNQLDFTEQLKAIEQAVKAQKLHVDAPKITLPAPVVNTEAPDLDPITKQLETVVKAIKATPAPTATDLTKLEKLQKQANDLLDTISRKPNGGGGGMLSLQAKGVAGGNMYVNSVESIDYPGVYGLVMLNPDGSSIGTGGGTYTPPAAPGDGVDNLLAAVGENILIDSTSVLLV